VKDRAAVTADADWIAADGAAPVDEPLAETTPSEEEPADDESPAAEDDAPRQSRSRRKGRSSIPSWDEIMFGGQSE
jgi:hypothetical protein